jgi:hypothetical protein
MSALHLRTSRIKTRIKVWGKKRKFFTSRRKAGVKYAADTAVSGGRQLRPVHQQNAGPAPQLTSPSSSIPPVRVASREATPGTSTRTETIHTNERRESDVTNQEVMPTAAAIASEIADSADKPSHEAIRTDQSFFWARARDSFEKKNGKKRVELMKLGEDYVDAAAELQTLLDERKRKNKGITPSTERAIRNILVYKDISVAAATFDPMRAAPTIVRGICAILQVW